MMNGFYRKKRRKRRPTMIIITTYGTRVKMDQNRKRNAAQVNVAKFKYRISKLIRPH